MILSTSSITVFLQCQLRWKLKYLNRLPSPQGVPPALGSAVHAAAEAYWKQESEAPDGRVEQCVHGVSEREECEHCGFDWQPVTPILALEDKWTEEAAKIPAGDLAEDPDALADAGKAYAAFLKHIAPTWHPTMVERKFSYELEGVTITGIIDSADERTDEGRDLKVTTGKSIAGRKAPTFRPGEYQLQRDLYDLGYESITGRPLRKFTLDVLTRLGRHRQYVLPPTFRDTLDTVQVVRDAVSVGDYQPTGAWSGRCHWCPYNLICPASTERSAEAPALEEPMLLDTDPTPVTEES